MAPGRRRRLHRAVSLTAGQFHHSLGNALTAEESDQRYGRWTIPAPGKPLFEAAEANFSPHSPAKVNTGNERVKLRQTGHTLRSVVDKAAA